MAREKGVKPETDLGKTLARLIARCEKVVRDAKELYGEVKAIQDKLPPKG